MRRRLALVALALLAGSVATACKRSPSYRLTDTEGRQFEATCTSEGDCTLKQTDGPKRTDGPTGVVLRALGRLVAACDVRGQSDGDGAATGAEPQSPADCRALVCKSDDECPPAPNVPSSTCIEGTCSDPARDTTTPDSVILCLKGTGPGRSTPRQIERYALGLNCGAPCRIPAPCRMGGR
jgi:hypothetical protein